MIFFAVMLNNYVAAQNTEPVIVSISVDTTDSNEPGAVKILYKSNTDADIEEFRIWYYFNGNFREQNLSIDNLGSQYIYTNAEADERSEGFQLRTVLFSDPSLTLLSSPNFTVFLEAEEFDECNKSITLRWNNYIGWGNDITGYDVYVKKENQSYVKRINTTDTIFIETDVSYNSEYKFYVVAKNSLGAESMSNIAEYTSDAKKEIDSTLFYIDGIVNLENTVKLRFKVDNSFETGGYKILMAESMGGSYNEIGQIAYTDKDSFTFTHENTSLATENFYKVQALSVCGDLLAETNVVQKIVSKGEMESNEVSLEWNSCFHEVNETSIVLMSIDGSEYIDANVNVYDQRASINLIEKSNEGESEYFCFKVSSNIPSGQFGESNVLCFALTPEIDMPNAFSPNGDGLNDYIVPKIKNVNIQDYKFIVYDRYGGIVFESKSEIEKWNGKKNEKPVKEGAYIYYLYYKTKRGKVHEKSGSINVVFP